MGNSKSTKSPVLTEPEEFFDMVKMHEKRLKEKMKSPRPPPIKDIQVTPIVMPSPSAAPTTDSCHSYDEAALARMRWELQHDSEAFLLNNILLSVQFFENFERELHIINGGVSKREHVINEAMVKEYKHVLFADRLQECVHEHVCYQRNRGNIEPLSAPRLFVIYDNVEASEPGDTSDYSAVLDAPFYKLGIEDCKLSGYVKLKKLEVLESNLNKENEVVNTVTTNNDDDSIYSDSEKESNYSDDDSYIVRNGTERLQHIKTKTDKTSLPKNIDGNIDSKTNKTSSRRFSGPIKQVSSQAAKNNISNISRLKKQNVVFLEETEDNAIDNHNYVGSDYDDFSHVPRKFNLKIARRMSGPSCNEKSNTNLRKASSETNVGDDTSGYRSNSSGQQTEASETESENGYAAITESATPRKVEYGGKKNNAILSGVLPDEIWTTEEVRVLNYWNDEEQIVENKSKSSSQRNLFENVIYLNSSRFMNNFVDNFIVKLGSGLGLTHNEVSSALTQGASIYCDSTRNGLKISYEIFPAITANWLKAASQWIIRERRITTNPRTNFTYLWPTRRMVKEAVRTGCLLVPVGFRPKRGLNPEQALQWKVVFPGAERYLENCLSHSHMRCYLFTLVLHKAFLENETAKIGIDATHIKNHLYWQCEDNIAKWPEDRLGESLRLFLRSFYKRLARSRLPNYFMENCNEFKNIPKPLLLKVQRRLVYILEAPVLHMLSALNKIQYMKRDFYPTFNCQGLYNILTCKNPIQILNPNIPIHVSNYEDTNHIDTGDDSDIDLWDQAKSQDVNYRWNKERQRQIQEKRRVQINLKRPNSSGKQVLEIDKKIPIKMEPVRRRLVLDFFITHFIAMARSSERYEAVRQAIIYLEQAQRLCTLLSAEPATETATNEYMKVIRDKLSDCQRKLAQQGGFNLPPRQEMHTERTGHKEIRNQHATLRPYNSRDSPVESQGIPAFTFVDVHIENSSDPIKFNESMLKEESKL